MQKVSYGFKIATNELYTDELVTYLIKQMWVECGFRLWCFVSCTFQFPLAIARERERCTQGWCCWSVVSAKAVRNQMWYGQPSNHTFRLLSKHDIFPCLATLCECQRTGGDHRDAFVLRRWRLSSRTWNPITSPWMKQLTWLRIIHSWDWCLRLVQCTPSGACHKKEDCC